MRCLLGLGIRLLCVGWLVGFAPNIGWFTDVFGFGSLVVWFELSV